MTLDPPEVAAPRSPVLRFLADNNPFYVLSACCMLFGVFAVNDSLNWSPIPLRNLITMILTLNVYEGLLIGLAIFLMRRNIRRDAVLLLLIEAFFLADVGFLNMEVFTVRPLVGLIVNSLVLIAGVVKVALVFRAAGLRILDSRFTFVVVQLGVLFAVPGFFATLASRHDDHLHPLAVYAGWWMAGLLPVAYTMLVGNGAGDFHRPRDGRPVGFDRIVARVLLVLPMLSLIAHLSLAHWVYKVTFHPADVAPLLLGLAVALGHADQHVASLAWRMRMQLVLPFVAVALSAIKFPKEMVFVAGGMSFSPLRFALAGATLVYLDAVWLHRHVAYGLAAAACACMLAMGHSVASINDNSVHVAKTSADGLSRLVPRTMGQWGMVSIIAAFILLAIGALISLSRTESPEPVLDAEILDSPPLGPPLEMDQT